jgi:hypothetical protein
MDGDSRAAGLAALSVCESILLSLTENGIVDDAEARAILEDAAAAHRGAVSLGDGRAGDHEEAAALIQRILLGGNSVRHASRRAASPGTADGEAQP